MATKIYIDQGHNPQNPNAGAESGGLREQDLVYEIGVRTAALLQEGGFAVRLSRPTPTTQLGTSNASSLAARVDDANDWGADWFLSLHANASDNSAASGCEAFVFSPASRALPLAEEILAGLARETGLRDRGVSARPGLYVLRRTRMPATLVELGFITNPSDAALMNEEPERFARGIAAGVFRFFGLD